MLPAGEHLTVILLILWSGFIHVVEQHCNMNPTESLSLPPTSVQSVMLITLGHVPKGHT